MRIKLITHWCFSCCWVVLTLSQGVLRFPWSSSEELQKKHGQSTAGTAHLSCPKGCAQNHRVVEQAELEGTHQDHEVQLLALHRTPQESHHAPESIVQTLLELKQAWCLVTTSMPEYHAQYLNWGSWPGGANSCWGTGWSSVSGWWETVVHHLPFLGFTPLSPFHYNSYYCCY